MDIHHIGGRRRVEELLRSLLHRLLHSVLDKLHLPVGGAVPYADHEAAFHRFGPAVGLGPLGRALQPGEETVAVVGVVAAVDSHLEVPVLGRGLVVLLCERRTVEGEDSVAYRAAARGEVAEPPGAAYGLEVVLKDCVAVAYVVDVVLVAGEDVGLGEFGEKRLDFIFVGETAEKRRVDAENDSFALLVLYKRQVFPQPFQLGVGQAAGVGDLHPVLLGTGVLDVVHYDDVGLADVERIIRRGEIPHEVLRDGIFALAAGVVVVVVAYDVEERNGLAGRDEPVVGRLDRRRAFHLVRLLVAEGDADDGAVAGMAVDGFLDVR